MAKVAENISAANPEEKEKREKHTPKKQRRKQWRESICEASHTPKTKFFLSLLIFFFSFSLIPCVVVCNGLCFFRFWKRRWCCSIDEESKRLVGTNDCFLFLFFFFLTFVFVQVFLLSHFFFKKKKKLFFCFFVLFCLFSWDWIKGIQLNNSWFYGFRFWLLNVIEDQTTGRVRKIMMVVVRKSLNPIFSIWDSLVLILVLFLLVIPFRLPLNSFEIYRLWIRILLQQGLWKVKIRSDCNVW